jgi:hypothetical protein
VFPGELGNSYPEALHFCIDSQTVADWSSLVGGLGIGSLIGGLVQQYFSAKQRHREWVRDSKKAEWRELIDQIDVSLNRMTVAFSKPLLREAKEAAEMTAAYMSAMGIGRKVVRDRIFIADTIRQSDIVKKWEELIQYVCSVDDPPDPKKTAVPTKSGYDQKAIALQDELIRVSREDLGID